MKKLYYRIDGGDTPIICDLKSMTEILEAEASDYNEEKNEEDKPEWTIDLVFLTDEEYENLPDA